jgi:D-alanyl-D-alanine endopeptidase (penicillin-binding protein 7)
MKKITLLIMVISLINLVIGQPASTSQLSTKPPAANNSSKQVTPSSNRVHGKFTKHSKVPAKKHKKTHHRKIKKIAANSGYSNLTPNNYNSSSDSTSIRPPRLYSYSAIAINAKTGEVLLSKNPNAKLPIASITKLMTAIVLLDSTVNLDDYITITSDDIDTLKNTPSRLKVGMHFRRKDLLLLALMSSENRAAHALARTTYKGGLAVFINKMNETAKNLSMNNTQFYDPTGLTQQNQSTASDLSKMVQHAYNYEEIRKYTTTKDASVMFGPRYVHQYINSDMLVRSSNKIQIEVSKTGFINEAGHCLVLYSIIDNTPVVMVFLNSSGKSGRILDAMAVKNYVLKNNA